MLARASRSACRPAPLVGSVAANVKTAGREGTDSFMGTRGAIGGLHLKPGLRCARQPGGATMLQGSCARPKHSTQPSLRSPMSSTARVPTPYKMWRCLACGLIYDEAEGWPEDGIAPGT